MSANVCIFTGNLTRDPALKFLPNGTPVCEFSIACNKKWKDKSGAQQESTEYINIVAWRGLAEVCGKYLTIGKKVFVRGEMKTRDWDKEGVKQYKTEIHIDDMEMLSGGKSDSNQSPQNNQGSTQGSQAGSSWGNNANAGNANQGDEHPTGCDCPQCSIPF